LHVQVHGLSDALFGAAAPGAGGLVELLNAGVPFIRWSSGPFAMSRVRVNTGYTLAVHDGCSFLLPGGRTREVALQAAKRAWRSGRNGHDGSCQTRRAPTPCCTRPPSLALTAGHRQASRGRDEASVVRLSS